MKHPHTPRLHSLRSLTLSTALLFLVTCALGCRDTSQVDGPHLNVQLIADQDSISPGSAFTLGIQFTPEPGWHIYWKNPGDSGLAPRFAWTKDREVQIQEALWPYPERITSGPLVNYGYEKVLIPFPAHLATTSSHDSVTVSVAVQWLVCKDECLPGEATLSLSLPIKKTSGIPSRYAKNFARAFETVPSPLPRVSIAVEEQENEIIIALIPLESRYLPTSATFFPEDPRVIANSAAQISNRDGDTFRISLRRDALRREPIGRIRGVLVSPSGWSEKGYPRAIYIDTNPSDTTLASTQVSSPLPSVATERGLGLLLLFAFVGGVLLNLMPCVFPILSIKILGFLQQSGESKRVTKMHGIAFSAGVLVSFWILAGLLLGLRAGGEQLGWGFQLQSPIFVVVMIFVFLFLGLLFLSDVVIGQAIQTLAGSSKLPTSYIGSFLNGVLATAVATPCTGPFMSTALAATLILPAFESLLIFTSLGLGMSAPYLLLSFQPRLLHMLPRPGAWMETFKQAMAFPLFASVIWLTRVFARQMGMEPPGLTVLVDVLWGMLAAGFGFWLLTRSTSARSKMYRTGWVAASFVCCIFGMVIAIPTDHEIAESRARACAPTDAVVPFTDSFGLLWESFSDERLKKVLAQGRPVYIDFTAEWCITCQVNERVVFSSPDVRELLAQKNVTLMRADWTSKNPAITQALRQYGRNGVPFNVIIAGPTSDAVILPNILTPGIVIEALKKLPG